MIRSCGCLIVLALFSVIIAGAGFHASFLPYVAQPLVRSDPLEKTDAIVVMAGAYGLRAREAAMLYGEHWAPAVILTREEPFDGFLELKQLGVPLPEMIDLNQMTLKVLGVPQKDIWRVEDPVNSTDQEAETVRQFLTEKGVRRIIVVTSKTHTRRACMAFEHHLGAEFHVVCRYSRYDPFDPEGWWKKRKDIRELFFEWQKMIAYRLQYALGR